MSTIYLLRPTTRVTYKTKQRMAFFPLQMYHTFPSTQGSSRAPTILKESCSAICCGTTRRRRPPCLLPRNSHTALTHTPTGESRISLQLRSGDAETWIAYIIREKEKQEKEVYLIGRNLALLLVDTVLCFCALTYDGAQSFGFWVMPHS